MAQYSQDESKSSLWPSFTDRQQTNNNEKVLRETQTLRAGCSKAEPKNFAPLQTRFPGARETRHEKPAEFVHANCVARWWPATTKQLIGRSPETSWRLTITFDCVAPKRSAFALTKLTVAAGPRPKFNQLEMVTTFTYKPSLVRINARNFELSW